MTTKNIETKVEPTENALRFFCVENAEQIVACGWYESKYCLKSCKFYENQQQAHVEKVNQAKFWNR